MDRIFIRINQQIKLSRRFLADFRSSFEQTSYRKAGIWITQGQQARDLIMIKSGCMAVRHEADTAETIAMLVNEGEPVIPVHGLFLAERSPYTYQFLCDSDVYALPGRTLESLLVEYDDTRTLLHFVLAEQLKRQEEHSLMLAGYHPEARIAYAHEHFRAPFLLLNREEQASFLGMKKRVYQNYI